MKLFIAGLAFLMCLGCGFKAENPYGKIETTDSQIFTYTDADVKAKADGSVTSDDTTVVIVGVRDNTGADLESIFNHAMTEIKEIFKARQEVYESWLKK